MKNKEKQILENQGYRFVGGSGAVKICNWCKKSLTDSGYCYKQKFYGIKSHLCCQMSPWTACQNKCMHCWRAIEFNFGKKIREISSANELIEECTNQQRKLLSGFKGNPKASRQKLKQAQNPRHFAISLIGEPMLYPKLAELITELRKQKKTSFLVTNGLVPEALEKLRKQNALPTQLYVSLNYPDERLFRKITKNKAAGAWKKFNETLKILSRLNKSKNKTRSVLRMTLVKELNMEENMIKDYSGLIKKAMPDFVEVKGFVSVGFARNRKGMGYEKMPDHNEIKNFAKKLAKSLENKKYRLLDEHVPSKVVLLGRDKTKMKIGEI